MLAEGLELHGVRHVFGIPGAKIDAVFDALEDRSPEVVVCRHEQNAAFMALATGRLTGRPGVCIATSGPGSSNLVTGLATATTEGDPVVAIVGGVPRGDRLKRTHQSLNTAAMFEAVTKLSVEVSDPADVPETLAKAFRVAAEQRPGAVAITLPQDVQAALTDAPAIGWHEPPRLGPAPAAQVRAAARVLDSARLPVMLVGARGSKPEVIGPLHAFLDRCPMPVAVTFQGAGSVAGEPEYLFLGRVGLFRNQPGDRFLADADVVLTIGYDAVEYDPAVWNLGHEKQIIHLDSVVAEWDRSYQPSTELRGHISATLTELASAVSGRSVPPDILARIEADRPDLGQALHVELTDAPLCNPRTVVAHLRNGIPDDATVACDVGSNYIWMARHFRSAGPNQLLFSNGQQTLGVGLPWAMAANFLGRRAVSVSGDGGFLFSAMELETATRNNLNLVHFVMRDNSYNMVAFQEQLKYGRTSGTDLGYYDIVGLATAFGATGLRVQSERDLPAVIGEAMTTPGVVVVDVPVDYSHNLDLADHVIPEDWQ